MKASSPFRRWLAVLVGSVLVAGCGGEVGSDSENLGEIEQPLPAGSNAQFIAHTFPLAMNPGERLFVTTTMRNTGAASPANDWNNTYSLYRLNSAWSWVYDLVQGTVTPGSDEVFGFVITAPRTAGTYTFSARMRQDVFFGQSATIPNIVTSAATQRQWSCTYVPGSSTIPATMTPNENRTVVVTVQNTGAQAWGASGFFLRTQDSPQGLWNNTSTPLTSAVGSGATTSFSVSIRAPATPGTYSFKRQMLDGNATGVGYFDLTTPCVDVSITVAGANPLNSSVVSQDFPTTMAPGESRIVRVTMNNTGTQTWAGDGSFGLYSRNVPTSLWGETQSLLGTATAQGNNADFNLVITAPSTPGSYSHVWQMRKTAGADAGFFGELINIPVTVDAMATAQYAAAVVSQDIPLKVTAGESATFEITMQNTGTAAWSGTPFGLYSKNTPTSLWNTLSVSLGAMETVAASATRNFVLNVIAPATPGTYDSRWRMRYSGGIGFFGEEAVTSGIVVTLCGNGTIDGGEQCDDDNLVNGDGCSDECLTETTTVVDLSTDAAGRTLTGSQLNRQLSTVAIGDVTNDGTPDIVVGENATLLMRNQVGAVYGFTGGASFLDGTTNVVTSGPAFTIIGAEALDGFGTLGLGSIVIGDVTGDSVPDLVVSAMGADGVGNTRDAAGEVYVFAGGSGLSGTIDVAAAPSQLTATIVGANASDQLRALAIGDLTGDGVGDLVLGATDDTNGMNAGAIYVVAGGASLTSTVDLASPSITVYKILGAAAGDVLGHAAAIGDFGGSSDNDLLIGASNSSPGGAAQAGSAFAIFGPINGDRDMAGAVGSAGGPNVKWIGSGASARLGGSVAVGHVTGSARADVVIGAVQQRKADTLQYGAANIWAGPLVSGTTYDLSSSSSQTAIIQGVDQYDNLGSAVRVGDWDGDGVMDIAVAAYAADGPANDKNNAGELTIVKGSTTLSGTIDLANYAPLFIVYGAAPSRQLGARQTGLALGAINGDGKTDMCVGSHVGLNGRVDCFQAP